MKTVLKRRIFSLLWMLALACTVSVMTSSCKSQKKLAAEKAAADRKAAIDQSKQELNAMLTGNMTVEDMERKLAEIKKKNLGDAEVNALISKVEAKIAAEKAKIEAEKVKAAEAERLKKEADEKRKQEEEERLRNLATPEKLSLEQYFTRIATAPSYDVSNKLTTECLALFESENTPILIIIAMFGDNDKDYDEPTTIKKYLQYLKDQKKNANKIHNIVYNGAGKIKEVELKK